MTLEELQTNIATHRNAILTHPLYEKINSLAAIRLFMQHHVYAVWDFMSLLKALQQTLTCVSVPWTPKGNPHFRYFINEIVTGEESDIDNKGTYCSHFELYLTAMEQAGADTTGIKNLVSACEAGGDMKQILQKSVPESSAKTFLQFTFKVIQEGKPHVMAAVFAFGRENLIPDMFYPLIKKQQQKYPEKLEIWLYYLQRHIEVDGGHHGALALKMVESLCGQDKEKWAEAESAAIQALAMRKALWDAVLSLVEEKQV